METIGRRRVERVALLAAVLTAFLAGGSAALGAVGSVTSGMAEVGEPILYYEVAGEGAPVIFIHGGQMDRRMWDEQFDLFAKSFRVIRYDGRGYGNSEAAVRPYSDDHDLAGLLDFLKIPKAHLIGLSLGGRIAIDFAIEHPDRVISLVAVAPGLSGFQWTPDERWEKTVRAAQRAPEEAAELWLKDPYMAPAMEHPDLAPRLRRLAPENARVWLENPLLEKEIDPPTIKRLSAIRVPTLVLMGDRDVPDIRSIAEILGKQIPGAKKVVISGAGHILNMEKPEEFNRIVLAFLKAPAAH